jgi:tetratricopeptide (TPR) repeat protein
MRRIIALASCLLFFASIAQARTWKSADGDKVIEGTFVELDGDTIVIRTKTGMVRTSLNNVDELSRNFVLGQTGADPAQSKLDAQIAENPKDAEALYKRALYHKNNGRETKAMEDFNAAIDADPNYGAAYLARGEMKSSRGELDEAVADITKALEVDPKNGAQYLRARAAIRYKQDEAKYGAARAEKSAQDENRRVLENRRDTPWQPLSSLEYDTPIRKQAKLDLQLAEEYVYEEPEQPGEVGGGSGGGGGGGVGYGGGPGSGGGPGPGPGVGPGEPAEGVGAGLASGIGEGAGSGEGDLGPGEGEGAGAAGGEGAGAGSGSGDGVGGGPGGGGPGGGYGSGGGSGGGNGGGDKYVDGGDTYINRGDRIIEDGDIIEDRDTILVDDRDELIREYSTII